MKRNSGKSNPMNAGAYDRSNQEAAERYLKDPVNYPKGSVYHTWALKILGKPDDFSLEPQDFGKEGKKVD